MATYYIDPTWAGTKSGKFAAPYSLYSSVTDPQPGDFILLKAGTTFTGNVTPPSGKSGTSGKPIIYGVYDATTGARIVATLGAASIQGIGSNVHNFSTGGESYIEIECLDITTITSATYAGIRLGSNSTGNTDGNVARYCRVIGETCSAGILVNTNLGVVGHTVDHCVLNSNSVFGILIEGSLLGAKVIIINNTCNSNGRSGLRAAFSAAINLSGVISDNTCNYNGTLSVTGRGTGIDIVSDILGLTSTWNTCNNNYASGIFAACYTGAASSNQHTISHNTCNYNGEMGITVSTGGGWTVTKNTCNYNGADRGSHYGRGIELYGGSTKPCGPGIVCFNECNYNYNYGGTVNNGTEGGGIGLDDYHRDITVFGNRIIGNEGNGIQLNPNGASGSSRIFGNLLIDNFAAPPLRAAIWSSLVKAQICTYTTEANVSIFNNTIILTSQAAAPSCLYAFSENEIAVAAGLSVQNNIIKGHGVGMKIRPGATRTNNAFYGNTKNVVSNTQTVTLDDGTAAVTIDPQLDSAYRPQANAVRRAGTYLGGRDFHGKQFYNPPNIGAVDDVTSSPRYLLKTP